MKKIYYLFCFLYFGFTYETCADMNIAVVVPRSGAYKSFGDEIVYGAQIAADEINKKGGILKQKLNLLPIDDVCSENLALSTAQMLSLKQEEKPDLVIGPYCSEGVAEIAEVYAHNKIFQIVPAFLNEKEMGTQPQNIIRLFGNKEQAAQDIFDFYNQKFASQKIALISYGDTSFEKSIFKVFQNHGKSALLTIYGYKDFESANALAQKIKEQREDVVLSFSEPTSTAQIIRKLAEISPKTTFITSRYLANTDFLSIADDDLDTAYFMGLSEFEDYPEMTSEIVRLRLKGISFSGLNIYGYTAVKMWAELATKNKSASYDRLVTSIRKYGFKTSWGETFFTNGKSKRTMNYLFYKRQGKDYVLP